MQRRLDSNGAGPVGVSANSTQSYIVTALSSQHNLFNAIDVNNANNPANNNVTITEAVNFTQDFVLCTAFCDPTSGSIEVGLPTALSALVGMPFDVVKDRNNNLYISTNNRGTLKYDGTNLSNFVAQFIGSNHSSVVYPSNIATPLDASPYTQV